MADLIIRNLDRELLHQLKKEASRHGVSVNEELRSILRAALPEVPKPKMSFKDFLVAPPYFDDDFCEIIEEIVESRR